ncbi:hypothetical protein UlMin_028683 [Ulmus minor]
MDNCMDFLDLLEPDMSLQILHSLEDPVDLVRISAVSRSWWHFVVANGLCKQLCLRMFPQLLKVACVIEIDNSETEGCGEAGSSSNQSQWESLARDHRVYAFLLRGSRSFGAGNCISAAISASSTDNYPEESIRNTLDPREVVSRRASYWSSKGQKNSEVPETLVYKLVSDFCIIDEIQIKPFEAFFQLGLPIYSAKAVRFRLGYCKSPMQLESNSMDESCHDDKCIWTYTSQVFPMIQANCLQSFKLPEPVLCIGGYLQIELLGRVQRQEMDGLFYICISHVKVLGRSLSPAFGVNVLDPSGQFELKRYQQVTEAAQLKSVENKPYANQMVHLVQRVRDLQQIVNILRENDLEYVWEDDEENESDEELFL